mgnify:CR=1 FL=1
MPRMAGMTPEEFRTSRKFLGLTRDALASALSVHPRTVARWENSESAIPGPVVAALAMMLRTTTQSPEPPVSTAPTPTPAKPPTQR